MPALRPVFPRPPPLHLRVALSCAALLALVAATGESRAQTLPPAPPAEAPRWVWTTLPPSDDEATIEAFQLARPSGVAAEDRGWRPLCRAPCGVWIPAGSRLRVNGSFRVSEPFSLPTAPAVRLAVAPSKRTPGVVLLSVSGGVVFLACIVYAIMTPGRPDEDARSPASLAHRDAEERASRNTAIGFASAGGVGMIAGLIAVIRTPPTQVDPQTSSTVASMGVPLGHGLALSAAGLHF